MGPSDSDNGRCVVMCSHAPLAQQPPMSVSQVPRLIFLYAPSPTTPGGPHGFALVYPPWTTGFTISGRLAALHLCVTRPNRVHLRYGSHIHSAGLRPASCQPPASLPVERAIYRMNTSQFIRSARLILAHQSAQRKPRNGVQRQTDLIPDPSVSRPPSLTAPHPGTLLSSCVHRVFICDRSASNPQRYLSILLI